MDWQALGLSLKLAGLTLLILLPLGIWVGRTLAYSDFSGKSFIEALIVLPLVLPPTVLGYYLLFSLGGDSGLGSWLKEVLGIQLSFSFMGLLVASMIFNIPFIVQPTQLAFDNVPKQLIDAGAVSGLSAWQTFLYIELPLVWPGVLSAAVLTFVHTLGEFGVVLMMGGNIPGETKTIAISIYDRVQAFDFESADRMSLLLLLLSLSAVAVSFFAAAKIMRKPKR
jgi:molybdate transport system permease protein